MEAMNPNCSICLESVVYGALRSTVKLSCGDQFHLDCICSAFSSKRAMQCPNCQRTEEGRWCCPSLEGVFRVQVPSPHPPGEGLSFSPHLDCCSVCLEDLVHGGPRTIVKLICRHEFHLDCVGSAFNANRKMQCPNCRNCEGQWDSSYSILVRRGVADEDHLQQQRFLFPHQMTTVQSPLQTVAVEDPPQHEDHLQQQRFMFPHQMAAIQGPLQTVAVEDPPQHEDHLQHQRFLFPHQMAAIQVPLQTVAVEDPSQHQRFLFPHQMIRRV